MRLRFRWPFRRHRRRRELLDADAQIAQAAHDRQVAEHGRKLAERARDEAKELGAWAREANLANRFGLRLEAAYRTQISKERPT